MSDDRWPSKAHRRRGRFVSWEGPDADARSIRVLESVGEVCDEHSWSCGGAPEPTMVPPYMDIPFAGIGDASSAFLVPDGNFPDSSASIPATSTMAVMDAERGGRVAGSQDLGRDDSRPLDLTSTSERGTSSSPVSTRARADRPLGATCLTREQTATSRFLGHLASRWRTMRLKRGRLPWVWRPVPKARCCYGLNLASPDEFADHRARAQQVSDWDAECVSLLRRLESGRQPLVLDFFLHCRSCLGGWPAHRHRRGGSRYRTTTELYRPLWHGLFRVGGRFGSGEATDADSTLSTDRRLGFATM